MLFVSLLAGGFYLGTLSHYFLADDFIFLSQLRFEQPAFWDSLVYFGRDWGVGAQFYRPLTRLLWAAEYGIFGQNASGWHFTSTVLYGVNSALLYWLAWRLTGRWQVALLACLLFIFHPSHAEPVSWIATQSDLLAAAGCLAAAAFYIQSRKTASRPKFLINLGLSLAAFCLALLTKEAAAGFFLLPLLYELIYQPFWRWGRSDWLQLALRLSPFWLALGIMLLIRLVLFKGLGGYDAAGGDSVAFNAFITSYSGWLFHPVPLNSNLFRLAFVVALAGLATALFLRERTQIQSRPGQPTYPLSRQAFFGAAWLILFLLPAITTPPSLRLAYLSTAGSALMGAAWLAPEGRLLLKPTRKIKTASLALLEWLKLAGLSLLLVFGAGQALAQQSLWAEAGVICRTTLSQIFQARPELVNFSRVYAVGLPNYNEVAPIFLNGFPYAVRLLYDNPSLEGISVPAIPIIEQQLLQTYLVEYADGRLRVRDEVVQALLERNKNIKDHREQPFLTWEARADWTQIGGQGAITPGDEGLNISLPQGGTVRPPPFRLKAPALSYFELKLIALPVDPAVRTVQAVVHWLVETPGGASERASAPLMLEADGNSHTYSIKPTDMSPFLLNDTVSEIQLELLPGLKELAISQAMLYRLP